MDFEGLPAADNSSLSGRWLPVRDLWDHDPEERIIPGYAVRYELCASPRKNSFDENDNVIKILDAGPGTFTVPETFTVLRAKDTIRGRECTHLLPGLHFRPE